MPPDFTLASRIKQHAREIGFELCGIAPALSPLSLPEFNSWVDAGYAGEMHYIPGRQDAYQHPQHVLPAVRSVIMLAVNYGPECPKKKEQVGRIARYANTEIDYHDVLKKMLRELSSVLHETVPGCHSRAVVDTAPLLERDFARRAGLGWFGKNTMLINKSRGSYFFLGAILTDIELPPDKPHETTHCGTCTRCLEACPTDAFVGPHQLDARKCISYLTIELRNQPIPEELRSNMQDWMFGCDICQEVCPWNRHSNSPQRDEFLWDGQKTLSAIDFLKLTDDEFRSKFRKTPLWRTGRAALARNAAIAIGNSKLESAWDILIQSLKDKSPLVRGAVLWSLYQINPVKAKSVLTSHAQSECDPSVQQELNHLLDPLTHN